MNNSMDHESQLKKLISFIPNGKFYFSKAVKAFQQNKLPLAKKYLERANQLEPDDPTIICQLAIVMAEMGDYEPANDLLYYILNRIDPDMTECYYFLGNNYAYLGKYKEALYHVRTYLYFDPEGEYAEEAKELEEILVMEIGEEEDFLTQGGAGEDFWEELELIELQDEANRLLKEGKIGEAIWLFREIIEKYPRFWPAYNNLALAYFYIGKTADAAELLEQVLAESPGNLHALCNAAIFSRHAGEPVDGLASMLEKIYPISDDHRFKLGTTLAILGRYERAYQWLKSIAKKGYEVDSYLYYWLAYSAHFSGMEEEARQYWETFVRLHPDKKGREPWKTENFPSPFSGSPRRPD
ncbi:tetratricopeptide repeat protein [Caldibacillus debilis]|uniref:tetratricopeptide repeat protein n=1 Tax=Caldibacillus debilis TaxID=301148 RepID=UPI00037F3ADA|nr:tetratricopeptide repeat protein [Caldibacillus debilis]